jgi:hypothetical protein
LTRRTLSAAAAYKETRMQWDPGAMGGWAEALLRMQSAPFAGAFSAPVGLAALPAARAYEAQVRMMGDALQRFATAFVERQQRGEPPLGVRALYDLWIDCAEGAYAELARDPAFVAAQAAAINAAYAALKDQRQLADRLAGQFGVSTTTDVETLKQRIAALEAALADKASAAAPAAASRTRATEPKAKKPRAAKTRTSRRAPPARRGGKAPRR